jgi:hypothetical protein
MPHEVEAFLRREERQRHRDEFDDLVEGARAHGAEKRFQLRKRELDRIEIRTVGREKTQARADTFNRGLHLRLLVHGEVVEDDDIAGAEGGHEHLFDVSEERWIIERAVEDGGRLHPIHAERGHDGVRVPMAVGRVIPQPQPAWTASIPSQQIGRDARLVHEDITARIVQGQRVLPAPARRGDISAPLFVGVYGFF